MTSHTRILCVLGILGGLAATAVAQPGEHFTRAERDGYPIVELPEHLTNPWPEALEQAFLERVRASIEHNANPRSYGNKFFENEKSSYPRAMMDFLAGNRERALAFLQAEDVNRDWHRHTEGIDFFASFTLKNQMRKYFLFGPYMEPAYVQRMHRGATAWTERDPLRRPHHAFDPEQQGRGWTPVARNSWADIRGTDNLRFMRDTSIYLMAEETGNEQTRQTVLRRLRYEVWAMYHIGMGEWDSENYLGHSFQPWMNLYDFAADEDVKLLAKAALDWMSAAAAVKYWRGGFNGPTKRDYYHPGAWRVPAARTWGIYYGGPVPNPNPDYDDIFTITSAYRPPPAVVALGQNDFARPVELLMSHPPYGHYFNQRGAERPDAFETQYIARTYQLGTLPTGNIGDANGFKMIAANAERGVDYVIAGSGNRPHRIVTTTNGRDSVGQYRNLVLFHNGDAGADVHFFLPRSARIEREDGRIFIRLQDTWLALTPFNARWQGRNDQATERIAQDGRGYPDDMIATLRGTGQGASCGFALEVGEADSHGSYDRFKEAVLARSKLERLDGAKVRYTGGDGATVAVRPGDGLPHVWRNGERHDWDDHFDQYRPTDGGEVPIRQGWKEGRFRVEAGGWVFEGALDEDGRYSFTNRRVD